MASRLGIVESAGYSYFGWATVGSCGLGEKIVRIFFVAPHPLLFHMYSSSTSLAIF